MKSYEKCVNLYGGGENILSDLLDEIRERDEKIDELEADIEKLKKRIGRLEG